jgi:hypothetical protein
VETEAGAPRHGVPMRRDDETERLAMDIVMRYERSRGWTPFDVSQDGEHYDIRSEAPNGQVRFIEVKGHGKSGPVILTGPELDKLRQLGERAFLYVATDCKSDKPHLRIIQDPMTSLSPEMLFKQVQWLVDEADWQKFSQEVRLLS